MKYMYFLPKKTLSRMTGKVVHWPLPHNLAQWSIKAFAERFQINLEEAEFPIEKYKSIGDFFIRKIKMERRPLAVTELVHPADSVVSQAGIIQSGALIQAKGRDYTLKNLLGGLEGWEKYEGGTYLTYYLCPTDYHRVHSPVSGLVHQYRHIPGELWPVNSWSVSSIPNLFGVNERAVVELESIKGSAAVVFVGATNVGHISLSFDESFRTNVSGSVAQTTVPKGPISVNKGDELGIFHMGSTVVLVLEKSFGVTADDVAAFRGQSVRVRSALK